MALSNTRKCAYGGQKPAGQEMNNSQRTSDRSTNPVKMMRISIQYSTANANDPARNRNKSLTASVNRPTPSSIWHPGATSVNAARSKRRTETKQSVLKKKRLVDTRCDRSQVETAKLVDSVIHHQTLSSIRDCAE